MKIIIKFFISTLIIFFSIFFNRQTGFCENSEKHQEQENNGAFYDTADFYAQSLENNLSNNFIKANFLEFYEDFDFKTFFKDILSGNLKLNFELLYNSTLKIFSKNIKKITKGLGNVIFLTLISSVIKILCSNFGPEVSQLSFFVCYASIIGIVTNLFYFAVETAKTSIENLSFIMHAVIPILIGTFVASGNLITGSLSPILVSTIVISTNIIKNFFIPMVFILGAVEITNNLSSDLTLKSLSLLIKKIIKYGITLMTFTLITCLEMKTLSISGANEFGAKIVKSTITNFVPVVGKLLSDSSEILLKCAKTFTNAVGIFGMITIIISSLVPVIKVFSVLFLFSLAAAILEPIGDKRIVGCLTDISTTISFALSLIASNSVMFILLIAAIMNLSPRF